MKNKSAKKKEFSVLIPVILVALMLAFVAGGLIYNAVTGGPEPAAEAYLEAMMEQNGDSIVNSYHPGILNYISTQTGDKLMAVSARVQKRIDTWYNSKIVSVCGQVTSYETEVLSVEDATEEELSELETMTGLSVSEAVLCQGKITAHWDKGDAVSEQKIYLMKIDDAWYLYGMGLLA